MHHSHVALFLRTHICSHTFLYVVILLMFRHHRVDISLYFPKLCTQTLSQPRGTTLNGNLGHVLFFHRRPAPAHLCQKALVQCNESLITNRFGNCFQAQMSDKVLNGLYTACQGMLLFWGSAAAALSDGLGSRFSSSIYVFPSQT